ncbi:uncharacterized protein LOC129310700 [Prosopis cineraria]|uniref:uncharacterized protein LOC129310700 n=1 Tax=Prosopis cineraria TaxID=364024 RepID=UPI00240EB5C4|nr:uncharacterized protein LOC129310700 [Prosopis cineraria]
MAKSRMKLSKNWVRFLNGLKPFLALSSLSHVFLLFSSSVSCLHCIRDLHGYLITMSYLVLPRLLQPRGTPKPAGSRKIANEFTITKGEIAMCAMSLVTSPEWSPHKPIFSQLHQRL